MLKKKIKIFFSILWWIDGSKEEDLKIFLTMWKKSYWPILNLTLYFCLTHFHFSPKICLRYKNNWQIPTSITMDHLLKTPALLFWSLDVWVASFMYKSMRYFAHFMRTINLIISKSNSTPLLNSTRDFRYHSCPWHKTALSFCPEW